MTPLSPSLPSRHLEEPHRPLVNPEDGMVQQGEVAGHWQHGLHHTGTPWTGGGREGRKEHSCTQHKGGHVAGIHRVQHKKAECTRI